MGKVKFRRHITPINEEIARLTSSERIEFKLSESPLFQKFDSEARLFPNDLGIILEID